jgi:hypothetical protein
MHALDGDPGPALEALERAIELSPEARNWAAADEDFDRLRGTEEFDELVSGGAGD